jgi:hypothetical protein
MVGGLEAARKKRTGGGRRLFRLFRDAKRGLCDMDSSMIRPTALLLLCCGCGPVMATSVVDDAEVALARAHAAEGEKYALYQTTLADLYLVKAKEEQGHARYADAQALAGEALKFAETATRMAAERRLSATAPPVPTATVQRPDEKPPAAATPPPAVAAPPAPEPQRQPVMPQPPPAQPPKPSGKAPIDPGNRP